MQQVGFVKKINGDKMELEVKRVSGCGENCKGCGSSCNIPPHYISLKNNLGAEVGDFVELKGETNKILKYTLIVYMIPFIFFIGGIALGSSIFKTKGFANHESLGFLIGLIFLIISFFFLKIIDKKVGKKKEETISVIRIL